MRSLPLALFALLSALSGPALAQSPLVVGSGSTATLGGTNTYSSVTIDGTVLVADYNGSASTTGLLKIVATGPVVINGTINGNGRGYRGQNNANGEGPGGGQGGSCCADSGGGGGHGGAGGAGVGDNTCATNGAGGAANGSATSNSIGMGSAGGAAGAADGDGGGSGGDGGGAVWIVAPSITVNGTITVNGNNGGNFNNDAAGGGAGGGILLDAPLVTINSGAVLRANGGNGADVDDDGGGGGGGRIKLFYGTLVNNGTLQAAGGTGPGCAQEGGSGTSTSTQAYTPPTISSVLDQTIPEDGSTGALAFTVGDAQDAAGSLTVTASSSNLGLVPSVTLGGSGANRTVTVTPLPEQNGTTTITLTVTDSDGMSATATFQVVVTDVNDAPTADAEPAGGGGYTGFEGSPVAMDGSGSADPDGSIAQWAWDCDGNGSYETVSATATGASCTFPDEGTWAVGLQVTDDDGGTATATTQAVIANVAPVFASTPAGGATEGVLWSYLPVVTEPGADTLTFALGGSAPAAMSLDTGTGELLWTPTYADVGTWGLVLTVDDGDGGTDTQAFTLTVAFADLDGDGMPDTWEGDNGLDPTVDDSAGDPDGDGLSNLDEFLGGTDPNVFDGPTAPVQVEPIGGEEVATRRPDLVWTNATDPQSEALTYDLEVYSDAAGTALLTEVSGLAEDPSGSGSWTLDVNLVENADHFWRVRAADAVVAGPWTGLESFFVNEVNEPPGPAVPSEPLDDDRVDTVRPRLRWVAAFEPDRDEVLYEVEVLDAGGALVTSGATGVGSGVLTWDVDVDLVEDTAFGWRVRAVDEHGLPGPWSQAEVFVVDTGNAAPFGLHWIFPEDGDRLDDAPSLTATETTDPEGHALTYVFEVDLVPSFDGADFGTGTVGPSGTGEVTWDPAADGVVLFENTWWHARVRAEDELGAATPWAEITFFVRGPNDAPTLPQLVAPLDGTETAEVVPVFVVAAATDPEEDVVYHEIVVARDEALTDVVASADGLLVGTGPEGNEVLLSWRSDVNLEGELFWSARAYDAEGASSDWLPPWRLVVTSGEPPLGDDDLITGGCTRCESNAAGGTPTGAWALLLLVPALRRRRR